VLWLVGEGRKGEGERHEEARAVFAAMARETTSSTGDWVTARFYLVFLGEAMESAQFERCSREGEDGR
jgi:hypothetical protein